MEWNCTVRTVNRFEILQTLNDNGSKRSTTSRASRLMRRKDRGKSDKEARQSKPNTFFYNENKTHSVKTSTKGSQISPKNSSFVCLLLF